MDIRFSFKMLPLIAVVLVSMARVEAYSQSADAQTSVCQVIEHPQKKVPRQVVVDADLYNVMPHGIYLGDQHCSKRLLQIDFHMENADASIVELHKFISSAMEHGPLIASGQFFGVLTRDHSSKRLYLLVKSVKNLQAKGWTPEKSDLPSSVDLPGAPLHVAPPKQQ